MHKQPFGTLILIFFIIKQVATNKSSLYSEQLKKLTLDNLILWLNTDRSCSYIKKSSLLLKIQK
jgi:hypothetical protein